MRATVPSRRKAQQLCKCSHTRPNSESQSRKSNFCHQFSAITYKSVNIQQPNDHCTASTPLYSPPPSQLTSAEPRTRSGKPVCQPPRITGLSRRHQHPSPPPHIHRQEKTAISSGPIRNKRHRSRTSHLQSGFHARPLISPSGTSRRTPPPPRPIGGRHHQLPRHQS